MNTRLTKVDADKVKAIHGKVTGFLDKPCKACEELMKKAFILIGCVESKTTDRTNPYRSGNMWGVTKDYANRLFEGNPPKEGFAMIDVHVATKLGLPDANLEA